MSWERAFVVMSAALGEPVDEDFPGAKDLLPPSASRGARAKAMAQVLAEILVDLERARLA
jgi:hypothetical protein